MSAPSFAREWVSRSFHGSISKSDLLGSVVGNALTVWAHVDPRSDTTVTDLSWQIPVFALAGTIALRLLIAPYGMWKEQKDRADQAEAAIADAKPRRRTLSEAQRQSIVREASRHPPAGEFSIIYQGSSQEAVLYASEIQETLRLAGWNAACDTLMYDNRIGSRGLALISPENGPSDYIDALALGFDHAGIAFRRQRAAIDQGRLFVDFSEDVDRG